MDVSDNGTPFMVFDIKPPTPFCVPCYVLKSWRCWVFQNVTFKDRFPVLVVETGELTQCFSRKSASFFRSIFFVKSSSHITSIFWQSPILPSFKFLVPTSKTYFSHNSPVMIYTSIIAALYLIVKGYKDLSASKNASRYRPFCVLTNHSA